VAITPDPNQQWFSLTEIASIVEVDRKALSALIREGRLPRGLIVPTGRGTKTRWLYDDIETIRRILRVLGRFRDSRQGKTRVAKREISGPEASNRGRSGANGGKSPTAPEA
jgi:hypothetical protein